MSDVKMFNIDFQWPTFEPFLFCVHHYDKYPEGNGAYGPDVKFLSGRNMGQDFEEKDGFRMYHGEEVPGFPVHPHRGFETITIVRKGYVDHADSLGAAGRYGEGDVQWMTAGAGVQHSEMFPLLRTDNKNTVELFQIWLNLPRRSKMVPAHFKMFWSEKIPKVKAADGSHEVTVIAGEYAGAKALPPPPDSWASDKDGEVMILLVKLQKGATINLPKSNSEANRTLYFFEGNSFSINNQEIQNKIGLHLSAQQDLSITANHEEGQFLVLQAKPIGEPVFQHGPFVMNTREDIINTIQDYQKTQFGGWPWKRHDMVHGDKIERFALYPDGKRETPS
ncbi:MAG: pirin family protein [Bdellovibrionia bacterium]